MCTVVFIPHEGKHYMASLRDEDPKREVANMPVLSSDKQLNYVAPIDPQGGGTWLGINESGHVIILLNGGFTNHIKKGPYARSRGLVVKDLLSMAHPINGWRALDLNNIEPFTLIVWSGNELFQLVWDGENKYLATVDSTKAHIWSSATLYNEAIKKDREYAFASWISAITIKDRSSLFEFFQHTPNSKESLFIKDGLNYKTLSYSFIEIIPSMNTSITYHDLSADLIATISV